MMNKRFPSDANLKNRKFVSGRSTNNMFNVNVNKGKGTIPFNFFNLTVHAGTMSSPIICQRCRSANIRKQVEDIQRR